MASETVLPDVHNFVCLHEYLTNAVLLVYAYDFLLDLLARLPFASIGFNCLQLPFALCLFFVTLLEFFFHVRLFRKPAEMGI